MNPAFEIGSMEVDGSKWEQIELKLADSLPLFFSHCWEKHTECRTEAVSVLGNDCTPTNQYVSSKSHLVKHSHLWKDNAGVARSLRSHKFVYYTPLGAVITTQHFSQIKAGSLDPVT